MNKKASANNDDVINLRLYPDVSIKLKRMDSHHSIQTKELHLKSVNT